MNVVFIVKFSVPLTYGQKCISKESGLAFEKLKNKSININIVGNNN